MKKVLWLCMFMFFAFEQPFASANAINAKTEYAPITGVRIAYRTVGYGHPIILAARLRGTIDTWDPLFLDELAKKHRVITFDYPGIGYSEGKMPSDLKVMSSIVMQLATHLKLKSFSILGWSWGGLVAQTLAVEYPEQISAVILVATNPAGTVPHAATSAFLDRAVKPINDLADEEVLFFVPTDADSRAAAKRSHDRIFQRAGVTEHIPSRMEQFQPYFSAAQSFRDDKDNLRSRFNTARAPKLIITGDSDISTQGQNWFPLMGELRNAQFVMHSQTGHAPQHQHPERAARHIELFLDAIDSGER